MIRPVLIVLALELGANAKDWTSLVSLFDFRSRDQAVERIFVVSSTEVRVRSIGMCTEGGREMLAAGWILREQDREVVWDLSPESEERDGLCKLESMIVLEPGSYEIWYAVAPQSHWLQDRPKNLLDGIFGRGYKQELHRWGIEVSTLPDASVLTDNLPQPESPLFELNPLRNNALESQTFRLSEKSRVVVYAIGEGSKGEMVDTGWIVRDGTGELVWEMRYRNTRWAGGGQKNRMTLDTLMLGPGLYIAYFSTDASHAYDDWNQMPPFDAANWGMRIFAEGLLENRDFQPVEDTERILADLSRVGPDRLEMKGFTLVEPCSVRVRCTGELGYTRELVDYGWILDCGDHQPVWHLENARTTSGGGSASNQLFLGDLLLEAGTYMVYYTTDGAHDYRRWNGLPPHIPESWGIFVWGIGGFQPGQVRAYDEKQDSTVLVSLCRMGDRDRASGRFEVVSRTEVEVYALGEGEAGGMYDYGWIEDQSGRLIWEMHYRRSSHAGGAKKNRMVKESLWLDPGTYRVYYKTDDNHSFQEWNDDPPWDPIHWGIVIRMLGGDQEGRSR